MAEVATADACAPALEAEGKVIPSFAARRAAIAQALATAAQGDLVVMPDVYEQYRPLVRGSPFLVARGRVERTGRVVNVRVRELRPLAPAPAVGAQSRDFH